MKCKKLTFGYNITLTIRICFIRITSLQYVFIHNYLANAIKFHTSHFSCFKTHNILPCIDHSCNKYIKADYKRADYKIYVFSKNVNKRCLFCYLDIICLVHQFFLSGKIQKICETVSLRSATQMRKNIFHRFLQENYICMLKLHFQEELFKTVFNHTISA